MGKILSTDPVTRKREVFHYDNVEEAMVIENEQDTTPVLDRNKYDMNTSNGSFMGSQMQYHVARIPLVIYEDLVRQGIADDEKALRRWLDDPDNRFMRTHPGRLSK